MRRLNPAGYDLFVKRPRKRTQEEWDFTDFTYLIAERNWAQKVLRQREELYERIGTGAITYNTEAVATLPNAIRVGTARTSVANSIDRASNHVQLLDQQLLELITEDNAGYIVNKIFDNITNVVIQMEQATKNHVPDEDIVQFERLAFNSIRPFFARAIEMKTKDPYVYGKMNHIILVTEGPTEQTREERRNYLKKAIELDPTYDYAIGQLGLTFGEGLIQNDPVWKE